MSKSEENQNLFELMQDMLQRNLSAWQNEEDSVQEEHEELITDLEDLLNRIELES